MANDITNTNYIAKILFDEFGSIYIYIPCILDESSSILSVCKKCMEKGYSFVWSANDVFYMISSDNKRSKTISHISSKTMISAYSILMNR